MHPDPAFAWTDRDAMRGLVASAGLAHLFVAGPAGVAVALVPMTVAGADRLHFHLPRRNRAAPRIAGATLVASIAGPAGYVSPDWYGLPDQVPTWNYLAVEAEGHAVPLDRAALVAHLDALGAREEARLAPKAAWTRAKMASARFDAMLPAIAGYELAVTDWRGTAKLGQNKPAAAARGAIAGLAAAGRHALAEAMRATQRAPA